jgi:hypothetical protein
MIHHHVLHYHIKCTPHTTVRCTTLRLIPHHRTLHHAVITALYTTTITTPWDAGQDSDGRVNLRLRVGLHCNGALGDQVLRPFDHLQSGRSYVVTCDGALAFAPIAKAFTSRILLASESLLSPTPPCRHAWRRARCRAFQAITVWTPRHKIDPVTIWTSSHDVNPTSHDGPHVTR